MKKKRLSEQTDEVVRNTPIDWRPGWWGVVKGFVFDVEFYRIKGRGTKRRVYCMIGFFKGEDICWSRSDCQFFMTPSDEVLKSIAQDHLKRARVVEHGGSMCH